MFERKRSQFGYVCQIPRKTVLNACAWWQRGGGWSQSVRRATVDQMCEAERWESTTHDRNPMSLVRVKGCYKRTKLPKVLTIEEFNRLLEKLREPYRTMALVALFLGPRVSEIAGLKWNDVDWDRSTISIARSWVIGEVADTKTEGSESPLPMDSASCNVLKA